jgi:CHAT domain-containing protein
MRKSASMEAQVWLGRYRECFSRWAASGYDDVDALEEAAKSLRSLLERSPDHAADVARIAAVACFASRRGQVPHAIASLAKCGLEADNLAAPEERPAHSAAILLLSLAEAELHAQRRLAGLDALRRLERRLGEANADDAFERWIRGRMHELLAELHELGREQEQAHTAHAAALEHLAPLLGDDGMREQFLQSWAMALSEQDEAGPRPEILDEMALLELGNLASASAIGVARSAIAGGSMPERAAAARNALRMIESCGTPPDLSPFEVIPIIGSLPPAEAQSFGDALVAMIDRQRRRLEAGEIPAGFTDPDAIARIRLGQQQQAELLEREQAAFDVATTIGVAEAHRAAGDASQAEQAAMNAIKRAIETRLGGAQVAALGHGFAIVAERDRAAAERFMEAFLMTLAATVEADPAFFATPRIRALFDRPIAMATSIALAQLGDGDDARARRRASALLDLLRRPDPPPADMLAGNQDEDEMARPMLAAADSLGRIRAGLRAHDDTFALVSHAGEDAVAFLMVRGDDQPLVVFHAGADYRAASEALERAAYVAIRASAARKDAAEAAVLAAGRRAFDTLPAPLRQAIREHRTLLLAPDFQGSQDVVPFELMHDGDAFLGVTRIIARYTSLAHLATSLDTRMRVPNRRRALVVAAPVAEGYDALDLAPREQQQIVSMLSGLGFDAPTIDPMRLSAAFFTDRLAYVDVLHVSAHGESGADLEWLVLPRGQRLVVDDLLQDPQYRMPFVYFNTCNLGQTRYLGAGVSRGLAYTLAELGAPAVIAHTKPVSDEAALRLATAFYDQIADRNVGDALLEARQALCDAGEASAWASGVLIGDPWHEIVESRAVATSLASDVLDAFFGMDVPEERKSDAWSAALVALSRREDPRLEAAVGLVRAVSELPDDEAALDDAIAVADTLHHLPARALLRLIRASRADEEGTGHEAIALFEDAIRYLAPLAAFEPQWGALLAGARGKLGVQRAGASGLEIRTHLPPGMEDDGEMQQFMQALLGAQQAAAAEYGHATTRDEETDADDIAWNAVVMGHPNRFEDMPESVEFAALVARKFARMGDLPADAMQHAPAMLAGLLRFLWDKQVTTYLGMDAAETQAVAVGALLDDIRAHWSPPDHEAWYPLVASVPTRIDALLAFIEGLAWEEIYQHLDPRMDALAEELTALLAQVHEAHPEALPGCAAYVCGVLMAKNTFSPLDGSVPESIGERLTRVYHAVAGDNEAHFFAYLTKGFEQVASRPMDELARWRMERT